MVGDINFFLYPWDDDDGDDDKEEQEGEGNAVVDATATKESSWCVGEVDVMIASREDRGRGLGRAAVSTFLYYIWSNRDAILDEYQSAGSAGRPRRELKLLMAKIKATNAPSIALFKSLGFEQKGDVNYFGEVKMVLRDFGSIEKRPEGFEMLEYVRPAK